MQCPHLFARWIVVVVQVGITVVDGEVAGRVREPVRHESVQKAAGLGLEQDHVQPDCRVAVAVIFLVISMLIWSGCAAAATNDLFYFLDCITMRR